MADFGPGSPTGGLCYLSDGLPEPYRGKLLFSEWGKGGLFVIEVARDGATFRFVKNTPLLQGGNGSDFRPMQLSVAADGSLLIADWQRDGAKGPKTVGTIWRLSWPEAQPAPRLKDESKATVEELLAALAHPDRDQRLRAQSALVGKGEAVTEKITDAVKGERTPSLQRMHAIWVLEGVARTEINRIVTSKVQRSMIENIRAFRYGRGALETMPLNESLGSEVREQVVRAYPEFCTPPAGLSVVLGIAGRKSEPPLRRNVVNSYGLLWQRVLQLDLETYWFARTGQDLNSLLIERLNDDDRWVRYSAMATIRRIGNWTDFAAWLSSNPEGFPGLDALWATAFGAFDKHLTDAYGKLSKREDVETRTRAITALGAVAYQPKPWDGHWWGTQPVKNPPPLNSVAWEGTPAALQALTAALSDPDPAVRLAAAKAFSQFIMRNPPAGGGAAASESGPAPTASAFARSGAGTAAAVAGSATAASGPVTAFSPPATAAPTSAAAFSGSATIAEAQKAVPTAQIETADPRAAVSSGQKVTAVGKAVVAVTPAAVAGADAGAALLEKAVADAFAALRARLTVETDSAVRRALIEALGVQRDPGAKIVPNDEPASDARQRDHALATKPDGTWQNRGDARRGEKLFFDPTAALGGLCATCHKVRGLGKEVGPDLSLIGGIYKRADLIVSILEPSKTIALGFEQNMIETKAGEIFTGALRHETADTFTLVGVDGQPHIVKKTEVKTRKPLELSLMPPGLTLALKPEDFTDLLAFLETLH